MSNLTPEQETALATFKASIHLPGGGFHALIVDLCREFHLPFQKVRSVLKNSQASIEKKIRNQFNDIDESDLTKAHWLHVIKSKLNCLAKDNKPIMETLSNSDRYIETVQSIEKPLHSEEDRERILETLELAYEGEVYKPLRAMLYTTTLYWELKDDLSEMTETRREKFINYPQHMEATTHLLKLREQVIHLPVQEG